MVKLFVYGTLRTPIGGVPADTRNYPRVANEVLASQPAQLRDARLLSFIQYPGIEPGEGTVSGELFELTPEGLEICDEIESHPEFFTRTEVTVWTSDGTGHTAWVYWAPTALRESGEPIESGDWFDRDRSRSDGRTLEQALAEDRQRNASSD